MNGTSFPTNCSGGIYMSGNRRLLKVHDGGEGGTARQTSRNPLIHASQKHRLGTFVGTGEKLSAVRAFVNLLWRAR